MRVTVLGTARSASHPRTIRLVNSLVTANHEVSFISTGAADGRVGRIVGNVVRIDTRWPRHRGRIAGLIRKLNPVWVRRRLADRRMRAALKRISPDAVYPTDVGMAAVAEVDRWPMSIDPAMHVGTENDLADLSGNDPERGGTQWLLDELNVAAAESQAGSRHAGKRVVLCYNPTETNPGRYLHSALERSGVDVDHRYPEVDLDSVSDQYAAVVFVESPYPALDVKGSTECPVLFWVHHGEHHLYRNLRLADRYRADAVLLAHSWHLGHRFPAPTYAFPFGVPVEMIQDLVPWEGRSFDVAMVGSGFDSDSDTYRLRRRIAQEATSALGADRVLFGGDMSPEEVFRAYADAKTVVDEGGERHRPITMRVFEAMGSGAALVTQPAPGLRKLFGGERPYLPLDAEDVVGSLNLAGDATRTAAAGHEAVAAHHTYEHRVELLFSVADRTVKAQRSADAPPQPFGHTIGRFAEIDSISCGTAAAEEWKATSYLVRSHREVIEGGSKVDVLIISDDDSVPRVLLDGAHRYIVCSRSTAPTVRTMLDSTDRSYAEENLDGNVVFDFGVAGYITREPLW